MPNEMPNDTSFLGTGWSFPPTFTKGGAEVEMASGTDDIKQSLIILLQTRLGERTLQEDFGCEMNGFLFEEIDGRLINRITSLISNAVLYFEPRITLDKLDIDRSDAVAGLLLINIAYTVRSTNTRYNMVYPFYLNEAALPG